MTASIENLLNVPDELRKPALWVGYDLKTDPKHPEKKPRKLPHQKWGTAEDRATNFRPLDHLLERGTPSAGYQRWVDPAEGFIYLDLDHVRNADTGEIAPWAETIVDEFDTYTEISASGTGLHLVCRGKLLDKDNDKPPCEIFSGQINKLMALTGDTYGLHTTIEDRQEKVEQLLRRVKAGNIDKPIVDWREKFRAPCELEQGEVKLLIKGILPEGNTMLGASSGVGKTWFALSMAKALVTGKKFLGTFDVPEPVKVLYLIPEQDDRSLRVRMEKLRLPMDGSGLRVRTMKDGILRLDDPALADAVRAWKPVVFLDTAIRFAGFKDENSAAENAGGLFATISELLRLDAIAVVSNHHIGKRFAHNDKGKLPMAELENLRGTGDLGAMTDNVWMIQPDDGGGDEGYLEESRNLTRLLVSNVKPRDFDPTEPFRVQGRPHIDQTGDFKVLTDSDDEPVGAIEEVGTKAAALVTADPKITKLALAKLLGCSRNRLDEVLAGHDWQWKATSKRSGLWVRVHPI